MEQLKMSGLAIAYSCDTAGFLLPYNIFRMKDTYEPLFGTLSRLRAIYSAYSPEPFTKVEYKIPLAEGGSK